MSKINVIAIFDIGKTNKKFILFDDAYTEIFQTVTKFPEIKDDDGDNCEDIISVISWMKHVFNQIKNDQKYNIKALNISCYGASLVYLNEKLEIILPVYNYLKPLNTEFENLFVEKLKIWPTLFLDTSTPYLLNLNAGVQILRLKIEKRTIFNKVKYILHLPQYLSFLFSGMLASEITSLGCHTLLWDFGKKDYHSWVKEENIHLLFPPIYTTKNTFNSESLDVKIGIGIHDSSAALIPYFEAIKEPFILISTGTWSISLNPFAKEALSKNDLDEGGLCYLSVTSKSVKASRLLAGMFHEKMVKLLSVQFKVDKNYFNQICFSEEIFYYLINSIGEFFELDETKFLFKIRELKILSFEVAYHLLIIYIVKNQIISVRKVVGNSNITNIYVDGGFIKNSLYMNMLALLMKEFNIYGVDIDNASAKGAALVLHKHWNKNPIPKSIIRTIKYPLKNHEQFV